MTENQKLYKTFCEESEYIPIFLEWWWIDSVTDGNWDVIFSLTKDGKVRGAMPFSITRQSKIFKIIKMPKQTQVMGCWFNYPKNQKQASKLSFEKEVMNELIEQLPEVDYFMQRFHYSISNWLPFYWRGYKQSTQYTYVLNDIKNHDDIFSNLRSNIRTDIKKATKIVEIISNDDIENFYDINKLTFQRQDTTIPYTFEFISTLHKEIKNKNQGKIYFAIDKEENIHAVIYVVWDKKSAYYMWGGGNPKYRNSGATSLLLWEAIKDSSIFVDKFDFEGSMIEPVERFVRSFGAEQVPYNKIYKFNNKFLELMYLLKGWKSGK